MSKIIQWIDIKKKTGVALATPCPVGIRPWLYGSWFVSNAHAARDAWLWCRFRCGVA